MCAIKVGKKFVGKATALAKQVVAAWPAAAQAPDMATTTTLPENSWGNGFD